MSSDYTTLAWRTELQSGPRLVFLALCDNANDAGNCFPSIQTLADKCGLSVRAVRGHVAAMEEQGLVQRIQRTGWSSEYQINLKVLRAAVYECLSKRPRLTEYDQMIMRSCAPETPADSAPRQDLPPPQTPADSAGDPGNICNTPRQDLPGTPANPAAITYKEPTKNKQGKGKGTRTAGNAITRPDGVTEQTWADWLTLRNGKNAPVSETVLRMAVNEADKANLSLEDFLQIWCFRGTQGLQADWLKPSDFAGRTVKAAKTPAPDNFGGVNYGQARKI
jgi:hypothetical protein